LIKSERALFTRLVPFSLSPGPFSLLSLGRPTGMRLLSHACTARPGGVVAVSCRRPDPLSSAAAVPGTLPAPATWPPLNRPPPPPHAVVALQKSVEHRCCPIFLPRASFFAASSPQGLFLLPRVLLSKSNGQSRADLIRFMISVAATATAPLTVRANDASSRSNLSCASLSHFLPGAVGTATGNRRPAHRPAVDERRHLRPFPPPHRRPTHTVMPHLPNLIRRLRPSPPVLHRVGRARSDYMPSERRGARRARAGYDHLGHGLGLAGHSAICSATVGAKCMPTTVHYFSNF
jgi:hypothetical protein